MTLPTSDDDTRLAAWLEQCLATAAATSIPTAPTTHTNWPPGPLGITSEQLATLVDAFLADPVISGVAGGIDHPGLSPRRLARYLPPSSGSRASDLLLAWFAQAGVVEPPIHPATPWRHPRRLTTTDSMTIAARLRITLLPLLSPGDFDATSPSSCP